MTDSVEARSEPARVDVYGVGVSIVDYDTAVESVVAAGKEQRSLGLTALATHGLMTARHDPEFRSVLDRIDIVAPDGQPVRWSLNWLHRAELDDRVYGPELTQRVCAAAAVDGIGVYVFGSTESVNAAFRSALEAAHPGLRIVGHQADRFREATPAEDADDVEAIRASGAGIVLVGRGCPRQEYWVAEHLGSVDAAMLAVGAAFDYHAGVLRVPPDAVQRLGLEWLWRLALEPRRLWRRYLVTNSQLIGAVAIEAATRLRASVSRTRAERPRPGRQPGR